MSSQGDFFKKFISNSDYRYQKAIRDVMLEYNAYETELPKDKRSNKTYLRNVHMNFFNKYLNFVNQWEASGDLDGDIASLRRIVQDILEHKLALHQQSVQNEEDFNDMLNEIDEEIQVVSEEKSE